MKMILALVVLIVAAMPTEPPVREKARANPVSVPTLVPSNPTVPSFTADQANKGQFSSTKTAPNATARSLRATPGLPSTPRMATCNGRQFRSSSVI